MKNENGPARFADDDTPLKKREKNRKRKVKLAPGVRSVCDEGTFCFSLEDQQDENRTGKVGCVCLLSSIRFLASRSRSHCLLNWPNFFRPQYEN